MADYLENRVSPKELNLIFKSGIDRSIFISSYKYFGDDANNDFYSNFINNNIDSKNIKIQEDAIELCIATKIFRSSYLIEIKKIIYSRKSIWLKLLCLDWLFNFFKDIPETFFVEVNQYQFNTNNELLKMQCALNLLFNAQ